MTPHPCDAWVSYCAPAPAVSGARFETAKTLASHGEYEAAIDEYARLLAAEPYNVDNWFGLGQSLAWAGETAAAIDALGCGRQLAPAYEDLWRFELGVRTADPKTSYAKGHREFVAEARQRFANANWLSLQEPQTEPRLRWVLGANAEVLSTDAPDWRKSYVKIGGRLADSIWIWAGVSSLSRFNTDDHVTSLAVEARFPDDWNVTVTAASAGSAEFVARRQSGLLVNRRFRNGWVGGASIDAYRYVSGDVRRLGASVERYVGAFRFGYQLYRSALADESVITHVASISYYSATNVSYTVTGATGEEIESTAPGRLLRTPVRAVGLSGRYPLSEWFGLSWHVGFHRQGDLYDRRAIGLEIDGAY